MTLSNGVCTVPFVANLAALGSRCAIVHRDTTISYRELAERVGRVATHLPRGAERALCVVPLDRSLESLVGYLAVLSAGHVAAVVAPQQAHSLDDYRPDFLVAGAQVSALRSSDEEHRDTPLHPELAVLLSTSGSTGSPKLVRLSHASVQHNAEAIAHALDLREDDRAITSLPPHYCYGLSIVHSHLAAGAALILDDTAVNDEPFWATVERERITTIAGVPHSFEMMLRSGLDRRALPALRRMTAAGGKLAPERARELARIGERRGWDLYVMYGQTEATARMSILRPAELAAAADSVGRPLPDGEFVIDTAVPEAHDAAPGVGEVVYRGPNVMLGYANSRADLTLGRTTTELRTGDLGYLDSRGRLRIVGRRSGFVKIVGKRIDLCRVNDYVAAYAEDACVVAADEALRIALVSSSETKPDVARAVARWCDIPVGAIEVRWLDALPRLASGKVDSEAIRALPPNEAALVTKPELAAGVALHPEAEVGLLDRVLADYRTCLGRPGATPADTFVSLGGDSLSFVELSVRLEAAIGHLPEGWQEVSIGELVTRATPRSRLATVDTSVLLRAIACVTILGTHIGLFTILGGAHLLLAVLGYNLARFGLSAPDAAGVRRRLTRTIGAIAIPSVLWVAVAHLAFGAYDWPNLVLANWFFGEARWGPHDQLWFIETAVWTTIILLVLAAFPGLHRLYTRHPFRCALVLLGVALVPRFTILPWVDGPVRGFLPFAFWLVAAGIAACACTTWRQRLLVSAIVVGATVDFYGLPWRETYIAIGVLIMLWIPQVRVPRAVLPVLVPIAAASLYIYLVQWQIFPHFDNPILGAVLSMAAGIGLWRLVVAVTQYAPLQRIRARRRDLVVAAASSSIEPPNSSTDTEGRS